MSRHYKEARALYEEIQPLAPDQVGKFLEAVMTLCPEHYELFLTALHTGMRSGEIAALKWSDVDFAGKFFIVRANVSRSGKVGKTKTRKIRKIDMSDALHDALLALKAHRTQEWEGKRLFLPEWIFANEAGNPPDMHNLKNRYFYRCLESAGLHRIRFHDLRHTYASILIGNGESLAYVKDQLGHSTIALTVNTYTHLIPGANRQAVNRLPVYVPSAENVKILKRQA